LSVKKITQRASLGSAGGSWTACVDSVNTLITDLVQPTAETARVIRAVANGDLSQTIARVLKADPSRGVSQTAQIVNTYGGSAQFVCLRSDASSLWLVLKSKLGVQAEIRGWQVPGRI